MGDEGFEDGGGASRGRADGGDVVEDESEQAPEDGILEVGEDTEDGGEDTGDEAHQRFYTEVALNVGGGEQKRSEVGSAGGVHLADAGAEAGGFEQEEEHDDESDDG